MSANTPRQQRARAAQRQQQADAVRADAARRARRRQLFVIAGVVAGAVLFAVVAVVGAANREEQKQAATTTSTRVADPLGAPTPSVTNTAPPADLPTLEPGATLTGATPCPPADGSAERTTSFAGPPPMCIDPAKTYTATIRTSVGDLDVLLNAQHTPVTTNNFVVLARYHYFDGQPVTRIVPRGWFEVGDALPPTDGTPSPGYTLPQEGGPQSASPLLVAMVPDADGTYGGAFLVGIADQSPGVSEQATVFGTVLDDRLDRNLPPDEQSSVRREVDKAATESQEPSDVITILGVDITEETR